MVDGQFKVEAGRSDAVAAEVVNRAPVAIVCPGTAIVRAAQHATRTIPILAIAYDLLGSKFVAPLPRPDSNTTGISIVATELDGKRQEILMEVVPGVRHIAALADPNTPHAIPVMREREHVLDPIMLKRASAQRFERALDVGCGEGRFCRMLRAKGIPVVGIDPTGALLAAARRRDARGEYQIARAESLPFPDAGFDLVVSYLTLIDIADFRAALKEMVRVLMPKGTLLIANLNSFITSCSGGWIKDQHGRYLHYPVDRYLEEFPEWVEWSGIRIENWHRPLSSYIRELLAQGLTLTFFDEPQP